MKINRRTYWLGDIEFKATPARFNQIGVNEIFGIDGCFMVFVKMSKNDILHLCDDWRPRTINNPHYHQGTNETGFELHGETRGAWFNQSCLKLPEEIQEIFQNTFIVKEE